MVLIMKCSKLQSLGHFKAYNGMLLYYIWHVFKKVPRFHGTSQLLPNILVQRQLRDTTTTVC